MPHTFHFVEIKKQLLYLLFILVACLGLNSRGYTSFQRSDFEPEEAQGRLLQILEEVQPYMKNILSNTRFKNDLIAFQGNAVFVDGKTQFLIGPYHAGSGLSDDIGDWKLPACESIRKVPYHSCEKGFCFGLSSKGGALNIKAIFEEHPGRANDILCALGTLLRQVHGFEPEVRE
tara:strand:- start:935 stop:1459 length:525 start_codon:yes stop_codon:yes gene_type:complete